MFLHSQEPFPVDFDDAWRWLGYSTKASAKRRLDIRELKNEILLINSTGILNTHVENYSTAGQPKQKIMMSVDGFKLMGMLTQTDRGRQVRQYYLELEKKMHALKRAVDTGEVELVPGEAARKRARREAKEDRNEELAVMEHEQAIEQHQQASMQHRRDLITVYRTSLGTLDGRDEIMLKDLSKRLLNPSTILARATASSTPAIAALPKEISIQIVALELGFRVGDQASKIGKVMARLYRAKHGKEPDKRRVIFKGRPIDENAYFEPDADLMEEAIKEVLA